MCNDSYICRILNVVSLLEEPEPQKHSDCSEDMRCGGIRRHNTLKACKGSCPSLLLPQSASSSSVIREMERVVTTALTAQM